MTQQLKFGDRVRCKQTGNTAPQPAAWYTG